MIASPRKVIIGFLLGAIAGGLLYFESVLVFPRTLSIVSWLICWAVLAALFIIDTKRTLNVLTRGFTSIAFFSFLLYPTGRIFDMKAARWSGGEVRIVREKSFSENIVEWIIENLTSAKISFGLGILFAVLALLSWADSKK
jgi:hypothetical protein